MFCLVLLGSIKHLRLFIRFGMYASSVPLQFEAVKTQKQVYRYDAQV